MVCEGTACRLSRCFFSDCLAESPPCKNRSNKLLINNHLRDILGFQEAGHRNLLTCGTILARLLVRLHNELCFRFYKPVG